MLKKGMRLTQPSVSLFYRKQLALIRQNISGQIGRRHRCRIIARIESEHLSRHLESSRAALPNTPLINPEDFSVLYFFASSTASLIDTDTGISSR